MFLFHTGPSVHTYADFLFRFFCKVIIFFFSHQSSDTEEGLVWSSDFFFLLLLLSSFSHLISLCNETMDGQTPPRLAHSASGLFIYAPISWFIYLFFFVGSFGFRFPRKNGLRIWPISWFPGLPWTILSFSKQKKRKPPSRFGKNHIRVVLGFRFF